MAIIIRPMKSDEVGRLPTFQYLSLHVLNGQAPYDKEITNQPNLRKYFAHWGRDGDICFVAESPEHEIVGAIWSRLHITEYPGYGFVDEDTPEFSLAVLPEYRGQGIGTKLLRHYLDEVKKIGVRKVSLSVDPTNPAYHLYQRLGFQPIMNSGNPTMLLKLQ